MSNARHICGGFVKHYLKTNPSCFYESTLKHIVELLLGEILRDRGISSSLMRFEKIEKL
jgi:hypothetical protein